MKPKKIQFTMIFGKGVDGFPAEVIYYDGYRPETGADRIPPPGTLPDGAPPRPKNQQFEVEFYEDRGELKALLHSEHGIQKVDDVIYRDFSVSFSAYSGSEGVEIFRFVLAISESTPQVVGFAYGIFPFFRGYMPVCGEITEREEDSTD